MFVRSTRRLFLTSPLSKVEKHLGTLVVCICSPQNRRFFFNETRLGFFEQTAAPRVSFLKAIHSGHTRAQIACSRGVPTAEKESVVSVVQGGSEDGQEQFFSRPQHMKENVYFCVAFEIHPRSIFWNPLIIFWDFNIFWLQIHSIRTESDLRKNLRL